MNDNAYIAFINPLFSFPFTKVFIQQLYIQLGVMAVWEEPEESPLFIISRHWFQKHGLSMDDRPKHNAEK